MTTIPLSLYFPFDIAPIAFRDDYDIDVNVKRFDELLWRSRQFVKPSAALIAGGSRYASDGAGWRFLAKHALELSHAVVRFYSQPEIYRLYEKTLSTVKAPDYFKGVWESHASVHASVLTEFAAFANEQLLTDSTEQDQVLANFRWDDLSLAQLERNSKLERLAVEAVIKVEEPVFNSLGEFLESTAKQLFSLGEQSTDSGLVSLPLSKARPNGDAHTVVRIHAATVASHIKARLIGNLEIWDWRHAKRARESELKTARACYYFCREVISEIEQPNVRVIANDEVQIVAPTQPANAAGKVIRSLVEAEVGIALAEIIGKDKSVRWTAEQLQPEILKLYTDRTVSIKSIEKHLGYRALLMEQGRTRPGRSVRAKALSDVVSRSKREDDAEQGRRVKGKRIQARD